MKKYMLVFGLMAVMFLMIMCLPFSSRCPDGLERVAHDKGFERKEQAGRHWRSPLADYAFPCVRNKPVSTICAGAVGTLVVAGVAGYLGFLLRRKQG